MIFDLLGQPGVSTCSATSFCSGVAERVSDGRVHDARLPYLRLILPPRARLSLYCAASASWVKQLLYRQIKELTQFLPKLRRRRGDAIGCIDEMAICDADFVGDQSEVPVSPPDDPTDGLLAEPTVLARHG
jgi:hypothetical protein